MFRNFTYAHSFFFAHYKDNKKGKRERAAKVAFQFINVASFIIEVKTDTVILSSYVIPI